MRAASGSVRRWGAASTALAVAGTSLVAAGLGFGAPAASAAPFTCDADTIYTVSNSGEIRTVNLSGAGSLGPEHAAGQRANALGISADGRYSYTLDNSSGSSGGSKRIAVYDGETDTTDTRPLGDPRVPGTVIRGAVSSTTGIYYYAGSGAESYLGAFDPVTGTAIGQVGVLNTGIAGNGDMAFGANGELYVLAERDIFVVQPDDLPTTAGMDDVPVSHVAQLPAGTQGNGIAFGANGKLFISQSNSISEVDLSTGSLTRSISTGRFGNTDLASCSFPNTLTLQKNVVDRYQEGDQFTLDIAGGSIDVDRKVTTTGTATGLQSVVAGPVFVAPGERYTLSEAEAAGADLTNYTSSIVCVDSAGTAVATTGNGPSWQLDFPDTPTGENVTCTITNDAKAHPAPGLDLRKASSIADGTPVRAGDTIVYTVEAENTGNAGLDPVVIADDLGDVLASAKRHGDVVTEIDGQPVTTGAATIDGGDLTWTGALSPSQVVAITYTVIVNDDAVGESIENRVTASGTPPGLPPVEPPAASTEHPVAGFDIAKTADPAPGSAVEPGDRVTYRLIATNMGATALTPATIADDLSAVLAHADYNDDVAASAGTAAVSGETLRWNGTLAAGASVTITYSVTVDETASGAVLHNVATGSATPVVPDPANPEGPVIPGSPITPPAAETRHPVIGSGFVIAKTAKPGSGVGVNPGDTIAYTVTGTNTGGTLLDPASITDNLSAVLANAEYNDDARATLGSVEVADGTLNWTGALAPGEHVTITYSVTVGGEAGGEVLRNSASGVATPRMPVDPSDPDSPTSPRAPITPPVVTTEHRVNEPGFDVSKSVDPASGTAVDPGAILTYTVTGTNTGETVLDPVEIVDDLSGVLAHASYNGDVIAAVQGATVEAPVVDGDSIRWSGPLAPGETVTVTYSVTVASSAAGAGLVNVVTAAATPPGGATIHPPSVTTDNPVNEPGFSVSKTAAPAVGTAVDPGSVITYRVTAVNTGETELAPVQITDTLSGVLPHAVYNDDAEALINGSATAAPEFVDDELRWGGTLAVGETVTITYSVTVDGDAGGQTLRNTVTGSATPPGGADPIETPPAVTAHPVNEPGFEVAKTADPASGTAVDPGSVITYTVTGVNTGETTLDPASISDDLSAVLANAEYNGDAVSTSGTVVLEGDRLEWSGALDVGERVTITYSVTVHAAAGGAVIQNTVTGEATVPGGSTITPPADSTENLVNQPGFEFTKVADRDSGSWVATGSVLTYTLTGVNTGQTALGPVEITDDLSEVLSSATYQKDAVVMIDGERVGSPVFEGHALRWAGALQPGETVTITYSVKVHADAAGQTLANVATASATTPGGEVLTPPSGRTDHRVQSQLAVTGAEVAPWLGLGALLAAGGALLLLVRRPRTAV